MRFGRCTLLVAFCGAIVFASAVSAQSVNLVAGSTGTFNTGTGNTGFTNTGTGNIGTVTISNHPGTFNTGTINIGTSGTFNTGTTNTGTFNFGATNSGTFAASAGSINGTILLSSGGAIIAPTVPMTAFLPPGPGIQAVAHITNVGPLAFPTQVLQNVQQPQQTFVIPLVVPDTGANVPNLGVPTDRISRIWYFHQAPITNILPNTVKLAPIIEVSKDDEAAYSIRHNGSAEYSKTGKNEINITSGRMVLIAHQTTTIHVRDLVITQQPNTMTQIIVTPQTVLVRTLLDDKTDSVAVTIPGGNSFTLPISREVCFGANEGDVTKAIKDNIPRKEVVMTQLKGAETIATSSFMLPSVTAQSPVLLSMYRKGIDQQLVAKLIKTAACLQITSYRSGAYRAID